MERLSKSSIYWDVGQASGAGGTSSQYRDKELACSFGASESYSVDACVQYVHTAANLRGRHTDKKNSMSCAYSGSELY